MLLALAIARAAAPEDEVDAFDDGFDDVVVVSATRTEAAVDEAPVAVEVISRAEIEATGAETLAELLEEQPGLQVDRTVTGTAIRMLGLDPEHTLILVDGQRVLGRKDGVIDLARFPIENIERVEIVKGPSSSLFGSDAMGGVVHIVTRSGGTAPEVGAHVRVGSLGRVDATADVSGGTESIRQRASAGWHQMDAWDLDPSTPSTNASAFTQGELDAKLTAEPTGGTHFDLTASYLQRRLQGVSATTTGAVLDDRAIVEEARAAVSAWGVPDAKTKVSGRLSGSFFRSQVIADQRGSTALDAVSDDREHLAEATVQVDRAEGKHAFTAGVDGLVQDLTTERLIGGKGSRQRVSLFAQDTWAARSESLRVTVAPGVRLDLDTRFGRALTPRLATALAGERATLRLSAGSGFRAPDFRELYLRFENPGVGYVVEGTEDLRPERSVTFTGGIELSPVKAVWVGVNAYHTDVRDLVQIGSTDLEPGALQVFAYENVARARTAGVDAQVRLRPDPVELELAWFGLRARDLDLDRALEGRVPHRVTTAVSVALPLDLHARVQAGWSAPRPVYVDPDGDGVDERMDDRARLTADARASWDGDPLSIAVGVDNLTDAGGDFVPLVPRTLYVAVDFRGRKE